MSETDDIRDLLNGRRTELLSRVSQAREALRSAEQNLAKLEGELRLIEAAMRAVRNEETHAAPVEALTIKQAVLRVLDGVAPNGLPALAILDRLKSDFGMEYPRSSLSPQLSRLKREGKIGLRGNTWFLVNRKTGSGANAPEPT